MNVNLLARTSHPVDTVLTAAMLCYRSDDILEIKHKAEGMRDDEVEAFLGKLIKNGHLSPFEHASFTFGIEGISRVTSHQLVRHRIASYSQRSQRYCESNQENSVCPESIADDPHALDIWEDLTECAQLAYNKLLSLGIHKEDARYILPEATGTALVATMNVRELRHFFELRCHHSAQAEIRELAFKMLDICRHETYVFFGDMEFTERGK